MFVAICRPWNVYGALEVSFQEALPKPQGDWSALAFNRLKQKSSLSGRAMGFTAISSGFAPSLQKDGPCVMTRWICLDVRKAS